MHTHTHAHRRCTTRQHIATETHNLCTNMHTHTYTRVYTCIRIHIHIHMHMYTYIHVCTYTYIHIYAHTHTHIYTHTYNMYICTHASTHGMTAWQRLREKPDLKPGSSTLLPVYAAHHTITTAHHPDYTRSSVLVRDQSIRI